MSTRKRTNAQRLAEIRYDRSRAGTRTRNWTSIVYPEDLPEDWRLKLDSCHIKWLESPLHDKDVNADGQPKKVHVHILLVFDNPKNAEQVTNILAEVFGSSEAGSIIGVAKPQKVSDKSALVRYFCHLDNPEKAQYPADGLVGHGGLDPLELLRRSMSEILDILRDIERFIEDNGITELCDLSRVVRDTQPEWYRVIATRSTLYINAFIRSYRHKIISNSK